MPFRVGVLLSGEGSNLQAILDRVHGRDGIEIACVASSRVGARGIDRARSAGVETAVFDREGYPDRPTRDKALGDWLEAQSVDLVVLAGFMEVLDRSFIRRFEGRVINVHPSLLPAFPGIRAIEQALEYGVKVTGVTVHYVDEGVDTGPVILQEAFEVPYSRDIPAVEHSTHEIEHRLLPQAVRLIASGAVARDPDHPRVVHAREAD